MFTLYTTPAARDHLKKQGSHEGSPHIISFGVKPSGCSGFAWNIEKLTLADTQEKIKTGAGKIYYDTGVQYFVAHQDEEHLNNSVVEIVKEGLNQKLKIQAPQANNHCGCGESFGLTSSKKNLHKNL